MQIRLFSLLMIFFSHFLFAKVDLYPWEQHNIEVFHQAAPLVVNIQNIKRIEHPFLSMDVNRGQGSGFLWDNEGHLITNVHVIYGAREVSVTFQNGHTYPAHVIGIEPRKDIAVLKIDDPKGLSAIKNLKRLPLGDSNTLQVGQHAIAIGNPFGLDQTMTTGVISALNRRIMGMAGVSIQNMIQTDASINPGNSGGPLLDSQGQIIGMNTLIYSSSGSSTGIGFAVPINDIKRIANQLIQHGRVVQPGIGVQLLGDRTRDYFGVEGLIIGSIVKGSPAEKAQLRGTQRSPNGRIRLGDIIIGINKKPVRNYDDLYNILDRIKIGETIELEIIRNHVKHTVKLKTVDLDEL
jgi:S1-C subfamily serine protease